ncbi:MAG: hypothetical protein K9J37_13430 [Saprospiraceae bacterium]|nr:hypothetical protein [Saprospiraceae bacterium]MCF8250910.1 hypothetical protein [Saprospiraceae bacterium]MCF8282704.1 hypothetical protein [Bacteroidales bacterium]MCF8311875.1 hypothetical protein [Saprospiraceae bacterium]MCF8443012.1 hypothetical protein [Saprospiraceae bacterium]
MKKWTSLLCTLLCLVAQSPADSLSALLPSMNERQQADFINAHFYTFYSNNYDQAVAPGGQALDIAKRLKLPNVEERLRISRDLHDNLGAEPTIIVP